MSKRPTFTETKRAESMRQRRLNLGLSVNELARRMAVTRVTLQRWETGVTAPPTSSFKLWEDTITEAEETGV